MKKLFLIILLFLFYSCAVIEAPSGGPKDTTPPSILSYYPENYTTKFKDDYVEIQFDKYMNKSSVIENLSITPKVKYDFSWSGKRLEIEFEEELQVNTTYVIKLKTEYSDFRGNKPEKALTFIFSTGEKIDKGAIKGQLVSPKPEGKSIFAWRDKDSQIDITTTPDYSVSLGSSGEFELVGLKKGLYRIIAVDDKMKNELYDSGIDGFGAAQYDLEVYDEARPYINLKIAPPFDRQGVGLTNAYPVAENIIQIGLSEEIFIDSIKNNFRLTDSVSGKSVDIKYIYTADDSISKKLFAVTEILDTNDTYKFQIKDLKDTLGNKQIDSLSTSLFGGFSKQFSNKLELITKKVDTKIKSNKLKFIFSHPIKEIKDSAITILDKKDSVNVPFDYTFKNNRLFIEIKPKKDESDLILNINLNEIIDFKDEPGIDSTFTFNFKHSKKISESKVSGKITDSTNCVGKILILLKQEDKIISKTYINSDNKFQFNNVEEGTYKLEIVCDENENMAYDVGNDIPFFHSEFFYLYDKDIKVKENWDVSDIDIILKQSIEFEEVELENNNKLEDEND